MFRTHLERRGLTMKFSKFDPFLLQRAKSINNSPATRYRALLFGLVAMIAASVLLSEVTPRYKH